MFKQQCQISLAFKGTCVCTVRIRRNFLVGEFFYAVTMARVWHTFVLRGLILPIFHAEVNFMLVSMGDVTHSHSIIYAYTIQISQ